MSFQIEKTKAGKPCIVFNNAKYRQHRTLQSGHISWRCLGRTCGASLKTDPGMTAVVACNNKHSGEHPVTMRQHMSPHHRPHDSSAPASPASPTTPGSSTPAPGPTSPPPALDTSQSCSSSHAVVSLDATYTEDLLVENRLLKEKIEELNERVSDLLNHSIESDTRLLQYTDQLFVPNHSTSIQTTEPRANQQDARAFATVECGVQCELLDEVTTVDCAVQCESPTITSQATCERDFCRAHRDLVISLKTTIEVLEAEIKCLKIGLITSNHSVPHEDDDWITIKSKISRVPVKVNNRFNPLSLEKAKCVSSDPQPRCGNRTLTNQTSQRRKNALDLPRRINSVLGV